METVDGETQHLKDTLKEGKFVAVAWKEKLFPGLVISGSESEAVVDCMEPKKLEVAVR